MRDYALFGGGSNPDATNVVDAYNTSLVRSRPISIDQDKYHLAAISIGNYALFDGGNIDRTINSNIVDVYTN